MASFVRIAQAGAGNFVKMEIRAGDDISDLTERACIKFPHWGTADQLSLHLVAAGGDEEPAVETISAVLSSGRRLGVGWSLPRAKIFSGAWLVALNIAGGGGGGGGRGAADFLEALEAVVAPLAEAQRGIIRMLSLPDGSTVFSDAEYEDQARHKLPA
jgi:hypothetical protein